MRREAPGGAILHGYGFDLTPLLRRYDELVQARRASDERRREGNQLRREITVLRKQLLSLIACAREAGQVGGHLGQAEQEVGHLLRLRGAERNPAHLAPIVSRMAELNATLEPSILAAFPVETGPLLQLQPQQLQLTP